MLGDHSRLDRLFRDWRTLVASVPFSVLALALDAWVLALGLPAVLCLTNGLLRFADAKEREILERLRRELEWDGVRAEQDREILEHLRRRLDTWDH